MSLGEFIGKAIAVTGASMLVATFFFTFVVSMQFAENTLNGEPVDDWWGCQKRAATQVVERWKPDFASDSQ